MKTAVKHALLVFVAARLLLAVWSIIVPALLPAPTTPDPILRPYQGQPHLTEGVTGLLLEPWQRFDTLHYMRIAEEGYAYEEDSVFPPLYPLASRALGYLFGGGAAGNMWAATLISHVAFIGVLIILFMMTDADLGSKSAARTLIYLTFFPTGFFLLAPYTESLFIFFALTSIWAARHNGRFGVAGLLGLLASLTRLTGWVLLIPLAYEWWRQWGKPLLTHKRENQVGVDAGEGSHPVKLFFGWANLMAVGLPGLGTAIFLIWRWAVGIPSLATIYQQYWYQSTGIPGTDLIRALETMFLGGHSRQGEFTLWFDFFCVILLVVSTYFVFRKLNVTYGLYSVLLLFFMLLPVSEFKPLYSFSRYTLAFFPTFMILAQAGENPWVNRAVLYTSFILYLYFTGQYFIWGWVA
ncbi:MAG: hypothetical protein CSA11_01270 [Chloroflexi bacterium]|nr:MAG: hypothetical protein CSA11_01270 [Chloroflexota bacterium]